MEKIKRMSLCFVAMAMTLGISGCAAAAAADKSSAKESEQPIVSDRQAVIDYLKAAKSDLELIDEIMADKDLGLLEEETSSEEDLTPELVEKYEGILTGYTDRIGAVLDDIDSRTTPALPDIESFRTAEKNVFQTLDSILQEYRQTLNYANTMLMVYEEFAGLENIQETDLQAIYDAYSTGIGNAIAALEAEDVPSFFESFNQDFIDVLKQLDEAVYYMLSALAMDDPVRLDAGGYLMGILQRRADELSQKGMQDLTDRVTKLSADSKDVVTTCEGLRNWLETNIGNLDGQ